MFRLTREVRFAVNADAAADAEQLRGRPTNGFGGYPSLLGFGQFMTLAVTVSGPLDAQSQYLINIKKIDSLIRDQVVGVLAARSHAAAPRGPGALTPLFEAIGPPLQAQGATLECLRLGLSPYLSWSAVRSELPMVRLSQKFEFSATHRLHNPAMSAEENARTFGKCNNPHGHGHNYEVQVTVGGVPDDSGVLVHVPDLERMVERTVIDRYDHKHLNIEVAEFRELIPSVENIAMSIYRMLKPRLPELGAGNLTLASVTVWETPKTWCEYSE